MAIRGVTPQGGRRNQILASGDFSTRQTGARVGAHHQVFAAMSISSLPLITGVAVEKLFSSKFAKMKLRQDAL